METRETRLKSVYCVWNVAGSHQQGRFQGGCWGQMGGGRGPDRAHGLGDRLREGLGFMHLHSVDVLHADLNGEPSFESEASRSTCPNTSAA